MQHQHDPRHAVGRSTRHRDALGPADVAVEAVVSVVRVGHREPDTSEHN